MKRFLCIVSLLLALTFCCITATHAESIFDFSTMSTSDLVKLRDAINAELSSRNFAEKEVVVPVGEYIVGVDIPAGAYTVRIKDNNAQGYIVIRSADDDLVAHHLLGELWESTSIGKLTLHDGYKVEITYSPFHFSPYKGLGF